LIPSLPFHQLSVMWLLLELFQIHCKI
jgi:hypothetical protein